MKEHLLGKVFLKKGKKLMSRYLKVTRKEYIFSNVLAIMDVLCSSIYPMLLSYIIDKFNELKMTDIIKILCFFVISIVILLIIKYLNKIVKSKYQKKILQNIRDDVFSGIMTIEYKDYYSSKTEEYTSFLVNDVEQLYILFFENLIYLSNSIVMLVTYTVILCMISWQMCIVIMGTLGLIMFVPQLVGKKFQTLNLVVSEAKADYLMVCEEILYAHELINENNRGKINNKYKTTLKHMQNTNYKLEKYKSFVQIFSGATLYVQLILCFIAGVLLATRGIVSLGILASSLIYVEYVSQYSANIVDEFLEIKSSKIYREKCLKYVKVYENKEKRNFALIDSNLIDVNGISYVVNGKCLYNNLSFKIGSNKKYLIEGANGSGKSTLLRILAGFIQPSEGTILLDEQLKNKDMIGYIPQRRYIFEGTVLSNITLFENYVTQQQKQIISDLCKKMNFQYPLNYNITRNAQNLSGGECAKICLMRELYKDVKLLIVDEPFNDIDEKSQMDILNVLDEMNCAMIVVAHGLKDKHIFDETICI